MYIKEKEFEYFRSLSREFNDHQKKRFRELLGKVIKENTGRADVEKIILVPDIAVLYYPPEEFVTRRLVKKAYKAVKDTKEDPDIQIFEEARCWIIS